ncbi:MAG: DUF4194 domain-containing protein [Lachnospiraceae bacterium]|nr:DUF4194 domain-containing protein [Lachnospiraceae bacterium]
MSIETMWEDLTSSEKDMFQRSCRRLLKQTFIVRDKDEENKKLYYFASKRPEIFTQYFSFIGFDIVLDRENGVIMLRNCADFGENGKIQANRLGLKKAESMVLCCLWTLYADRLRSGSLAQTIIVSMTDLRFALEKYGMKEPLDKTTMANILNLLSKYNLIDVNGKIGEADCLIRLYASLQFALDTEEFKKFVEATEKRMLVKEGAETEDTEDDAE